MLLPNSTANELLSVYPRYQGDHMPGQLPGHFKHSA